MNRFTPEQMQPAVELIKLLAKIDHREGVLKRLAIEKRDAARAARRARHEG